MSSTFCSVPRALCALTILLSVTPAPAGDSKLSADRFAAAVLASNPTLPMMHAAWQTAHARIKQVSALDDPMLKYSVAPLTAGNDDRDFGFQIELSQKFPWPGKRPLRGEGAARAAEAAKERVDALKLKLAASAKMLFSEWYWIHEAIEINRLERELLKAFRAVAEARYAAGNASRQDPLRAEMEFHRAGRRSIHLESERRRIAARANTLLNRPPDAHLPPPEKLPETVDLPDAAKLLAAAAAQRPELRELAARLKAFEARVDLARYESYPDFNLSAGYNSLWDREESRFTVGVGMNLPLDQSKRRAAQDEAQAALARTAWALAERKANIAEEIQIAYEGFRESRDALASFREQLLPLAEETLTAAKTEYAAGGGDFLRLIEAEQAAINTRLQSERTLADMHRWLAELGRAAGGFDLVVFGGEVLIHGR